MDGLYLLNIGDSSSRIVVSFGQPARPPPGGSHSAVYPVVWPKCIIMRWLQDVIGSCWSVLFFNMDYLLLKVKCRQRVEGGSRRGSGEPRRRLIEPASCTAGSAHQHTSSAPNAADSAPDSAGPAPAAPCCPRGLAVGQGGGPGERGVPEPVRDELGRVGVKRMNVLRSSRWSSCQWNWSHVIPCRLELA